MNSLVLPTTPRERPASTIQGTRDLLYGPPKAGKTPFALTFPNCLMIDCEGGARLYGGMIYDVLDEAAGGNQLDLIRSIIAKLQKECPYDTVVIDSVTAVSRWFEREAVAELNDEHGCGKNGKPLYRTAADVKWGAGFSRHRTKVMAFIESFTTILPKNVTKIVIAHSKTMISSENGSATKVLDLPGELERWVPRCFDSMAAIRFNASLGKTTATFSGYETETPEGFKVTHAGSRIPELAGKEIEATYQAIVEAINGHDPH